MADPEPFVARFPSSEKKEKKKRQTCVSPLSEPRIRLNPNTRWSRRDATQSPGEWFFLAGALKVETATTSAWFGSRRPGDEGGVEGLKGGGSGKTNGKQ